MLIVYSFLNDNSGWAIIAGLAKKAYILNNNLDKIKKQDLSSEVHSHERPVLAFSSPPFSRCLGVNCYPGPLDSSPPIKPTPSAKDDSSWFNFSSFFRSNSCPFFIVNFISSRCRASWSNTEEQEQWDRHPSKRIQRARVIFTAIEKPALLAIILPNHSRRNVANLLPIPKQVHATSGDI